MWVALEFAVTEGSSARSDPPNLIGLEDRNIGMSSCLRPAHLGQARERSILSRRSRSDRPHRGQLR
jgi:hypothetical protein